MTTCLFVGSFQTTSEGRGGGQNRQCELILRTLPEPGWRWLPFDVTAESTSQGSIPARLLRGVRRLRDLRRTARDCGASVALVFSSCYPMSLLEKGMMGLLLRWSGLRVVYSYRSQLQLPLRRPVAWMLRLCHWAGDMHLVQGKAAAAALREQGMATERIDILPNLVDVASWETALAHKRDAAAAEVGSPLALVYVGWLEDIKGVDVLLRALALLDARGVAWTLLVCGMGTRGQALAELARELGVDGRIQWSGWRDHAGLLDAFVQADAMVLPSRSEGLPNAILEAFCAGLPVVATKVGGVPGVVDDGVSGLLSPPDDPVALAACLATMACDRSRIKPMGLAGHAFVCRNHGDQAIMATLRSALAPAGAGDVSPESR